MNIEPKDENAAGQPDQTPKAETPPQDNADLTPEKVDEMIASQWEKDMKIIDQENKSAIELARKISIMNHYEWFTSKICSERASEKRENTEAMINFLMRMGFVEKQVRGQGLWFRINTDVEKRMEYLMHRWDFLTIEKARLEYLLNRVKEGAEEAKKDGEVTPTIEG